MSKAQHLACISLCLLIADMAVIWALADTTMYFTLFAAFIFAPVLAVMSIFFVVLSSRERWKGKQ